MTGQAPPALAQATPDQTQVAPDQTQVAPDQTQVTPDQTQVVSLEQPIPLVPSATMALLIGCGLVAGSVAGQLGALTAVAVVQVLLVLSWVSATAMPGRIGALLIGLAGAAGADAAAMRWYEHGYESALAPLGVALAIMFCHQLSRGVVRKRVVESLSGITLLLIAVSAASGLLLLRREAAGEHVMSCVVAVTAAGLVVAHLVDAFAPRVRFDAAIARGVPALLLGTAAGAVASVLAMRGTGALPQSRALVAGAGLAAMACLLSVGTSFSAAANASQPSGPAFMRPLAAVSLVFCLSVPAGYVLLNALSTS